MNIISYIKLAFASYNMRELLRDIVLVFFIFASLFSLFISSIFLFRGSGGGDCEEGEEVIVKDTVYNNSAPIVNDTMSVDKGAVNYPQQSSGNIMGYPKRKIDVVGYPRAGRAEILSASDPCRPWSQWEAFIVSDKMGPAYMAYRGSKRLDIFVNRDNCSRATRLFRYDDMHVKTLTGKLLSGYTLTCYSNERGQTDNTPNIMASGRIVSHRDLEQAKYIAVTQDWIDGGYINYGDMIFIRKYGFCN